MNKIIVNKIKCKKCGAVDSVKDYLGRLWRIIWSRGG